MVRRTVMLQMLHLPVDFKITGVIINPVINKATTIKLKN